MKIGKLQLAIILISIIIIEIISFLLLPDGKLSILDSVLQITKEDRELFWRQRPHLNTMFQGVNIVTNDFGFRNKKVDVNKNKQTYRIICLGASPTFGWGVDFKDTYPFILEQKIKKSIASVNIEVINAGQIGYTSHQGIILLEKVLLNFSPDLITVSYGLNDIDRYRFYSNTGVSDKELAMGNRLAIGINNAVSKIRTYLFIKNVISELIYKNKKLASSVFKKQFNVAKIRVSEQDYRENLKRIINITRVNNIKLVFIKMPINLSLPHLTDAENNILKNGRNLSNYYYDLADKYEKKLDYQNASLFFKKAKDYQVIECVRDGVNYQKIMDEVSREYDIPLVDAVKIFSLEGKNRSLFNIPHDPIHPNSEGHKIIAEYLYREIMRLPDF